MLGMRWHEGLSILTVRPHEVRFENGIETKAHCCALQADYI